MIVQEPQQALRRIVQHVLRRCRPDCGSHRQQVIAHEGMSQPMLTQIVAQAHALRRVGKALLRLRIEAADVDQHAPEIRADQVAALSEEHRRRGTTILEPAIVAGDREGHVRLRNRYVEVVEEGIQIGIVPVVEHNEPGIHRDHPVTRIHLDRIRVATDVLRTFIDRDPVPLGQQPAGGHARDAGTDDRDVAIGVGASVHEIPVLLQECVGRVPLSGCRTRERQPRLRWDRFIGSLGETVAENAHRV